MNVHCFILETHGTNDSFLENFHAFWESVEDEKVA
jgi:hypothetical protein